MASLPALLSPEQKRALLAKLLRQRRPNRWPLSFGQRAMWFLHHLEPEAAAYNLGEALLIDGTLDLAAMHRAVAQLGQRHRVLSTRIAPGPDGEPYQEWLDAQPLRLEEVDATGWAHHDLLARLGAEVDRPFHLAGGPMARLSVYRLGPTRHAVLLALHHIVGEFWTLVILVNDLAALYHAEATHTQSGLPPVTTEYAEFSHWQHQLLAGAEGERLWSFWRETLAGDIPQLTLPTDRPRPAVKTYRGALHGFGLGEQVARRVRDFARTTAATPHQTLLAAFAVFLHRHAGQDELTIGVPMTGRLDARWASVVGYFDNALPLRLRLGAATTFRELTAGVRSVALDAFAHQGLPFPLLVQRLQPRRDPSRSPLFDVMFVLRKAQPGGTDSLAGMGMGGSGSQIMLAPGLQATSLELPRTVSQFDLTLSLAESADGLRGSWEYNTDLFDHSTIELFTERFAVLLDELLAAADRPVDAVPMLPSGERHRIVEEWNDTAGPLPDDHRLQAGFIARAAEQPDADAVIGDGVRLSYAELDGYSEAVAGWLERSSVRPGELVAICMRKGWEQIVAALGVCKSGAAYLPVSADLPVRRVAELLRLGRVRHVLVHPESADAVPTSFSGHRFLVDESALRAAPPRGPAPVEIAPDGLAYVIFTSGSTGVPKGVMIDHRAASNTIHDVNARLGVGRCDRLLALSSLSFDLSVYDIFGVLGAGGTIVVPARDRLMDPAHWLDLVRREHITLWNSVPTLAQLAVEEAERHAGDPLRQVRAALLSGDWIPLDLPDRLRDGRPNLRVVSLGGATEAAIWSIWCDVGKVDPGWRSIPYGRPMANQRFHVLNRAGQLCPPGVAGELWIGGIGVAQGYWGDRHRTDESFVTHPALGRLYRSGDFGRYGPDGVIEFLGRTDHQVKIRGFRVELGEVEAALRDHPDVRDAVVIAVGEREVRRLVGFVLAEPAATGPIEQHCHSLLARYMVPAVIIAMPKFPLTGNGKVDRVALVDLATQNGAARQLTAAPTDERQRILCDLLSDLLGGTAVGVRDDFFALGADSVTAIRLCTAARLAGLALTPAQVFAARTAENMATLAKEVRIGTPPSGPDQSGHGVEPTDVHRLSPMQWTMLLHHAASGRPELYCEQVRVRLAGPVDAGMLALAWRQVIKRHPALRARFEFGADGRPVQRFAADGAVTLDVLDLPDGGADDADRRLRAFLDSDRRRGFVDTDCLLMRWTLVRLPDGGHELVWTHHHLLLDGWSLSVVLRELPVLYNAAVAGRAPVLDPAPQFTAFLDWLDRTDASHGEERERFWREELADMAQPCRAVSAFAGGPSPDGARAGTSDHRHAEVELRLTADETTTVTRAAGERGVTVNTMVQAAWALLLSRWTGDPDVVFGVTTTGRPADLDGVEGMVGLFINTMPLRLPVTPATSVSEWLRDVQARQTRVSAHDTCTLAEVERCSGLPRPPQEMALFDTIVVFENYPELGPAGTTEAELSIEDVRFTEVTGTRLMLYVFPGKEATLRITFDEAFVAADTARGILDRFRTVLCGLGADPTRSLADVPGHTTAQSREAVITSVREPGQSRPVVDLILEQANRQPTRIAVADGARRVTYRELVDTATRLAGLIVDGAGPDTIVALLLPRGLDAVAAIVGVLLSGAAYLPLDPDGPTERTARILAEAEPALVLTTMAYADTVRAVTAARMLLVDDGASGIPTVLRVAEDRLAYIMYTSGSTGQPVGAMVSREALATFVAGAAACYRLSPDDRVLQFAPLHFDASVEELFVTLCAGASLVVRPDDMMRSMTGFLDGCAAHGITVLDLPTAFWHELAYIVANGAALPPSVHTVIIGGEAALPERVDRWRRSVGRTVRLLNTYGPTEATVVALTADLTAEDAEAGVPIGRPLPGVRAVVLDAHGYPVLPGGAGVLHLIGAILARGYLRRPDLDERRFLVLDRLDAAPRAYRTGDLVRQRADGQLVFLGRDDDEFKISGHRVDPAEIETVLLGHPGVRDAAVAGILGPDGARHLSAHVIAVDPRSGPTAGALRDLLRRELPATLVPTSIVFTDRLPTTSSGKVDRKALRALPPPTCAIVRADPPTTDLERTLLAIWEQVLGVPVPGVRNDFFELGGQSLQTIQAANRISAALGRDVPVASVFRYPTVAALAAAIAGELDQAHPSAEVPAAVLADAILDDDVVPIGPARVPLAGPVRRPLLTGATGFVGARLLAELLATDVDEVVCPVRADDQTAAENRIRQALAGQGLPCTDLDRVRTIPADLSLPLLGLGAERFAAAAEGCDAIYHNAASVSLMRDYQSLRAVNVSGTREILRLATTGRPKPVHYVSTLSIAPPATLLAEVPETFLPLHPAIWDGYPQTKWVAERLVQQAGERGLTVRVYRLGRVLGAADTAVVNQRDFLMRALLSSIRVGVLPELDATEPWAPVDFVARAIVRLSAITGPTVFNLAPTAPVHLTDLVTWIREYGYPVTQRPVEQWRARLDLTDADSAALAFLDSRMGGPAGAADFGSLGQVCCTNVSDGLAGTGITCPPVNRPLLHRYLDHCVDIGLLSAPTGPSVR